MQTICVATVQYISGNTVQYTGPYFNTNCFNITEITLLYFYTNRCNFNSHNRQKYYSFFSEQWHICLSQKWVTTCKEGKCRQICRIYITCAISAWACFVAFGFTDYIVSKDQPAHFPGLALKHWRKYLNQFILHFLSLFFCDSVVEIHLRHHILVLFI